MIDVDGFTIRAATIVECDRCNWTAVVESDSDVIVATSTHTSDHDAGTRLETR